MISIGNLTSFFEISRVDKAKLRTMSGIKMLNECVGQQFRITNWAEAECHMEKGDEVKDYKIYLICTEDGEWYQTSSKSFWKDIMSYEEIIREEKEAGARITGLVIFLLSYPSKNYTGEFFRAELAGYIEDED